MGKEGPVLGGEQLRGAEEVKLSESADRECPRVRQKLCREGKRKRSAACSALGRDGFPLGEYFWQLPSSANCCAARYGSDWRGRAKSKLITQN